MKKTLICIFSILIITNLVYAKVVSKITREYSDGTPKEVTYYIKDKIIAYKTLFNNGQVKNFVGNIPNGIVYRYFPNGKLESTAEYSNNKLNGKLTIFYNNGKIHYEGTMKNNNFVRSIKEYDQNGKLIINKSKTALPVTTKDNHENKNSLIYDNQILLAYLAKPVFNPHYELPKTHCYQLAWMQPVQKLDNGYLIGGHPVFGEPTSNYEYAFLYTNENLPEGQLLNKYFVYYVGTYSYTAINGFQRTIYAFKIYKKDQ